VLEGTLQSIVGNRALFASRSSFAIRLTACFLAVGLATIFIGLAPEANLIWVANGILLAYLLAAPKRRWAAYLCAGFAAQFAGTLAVNPHLRINMIIGVLNMAEVLIGASLMRRGKQEPPRFSDRDYVLRFVAYAVFAAPMLTGIGYAAALWLMRHADPAAALMRWALTDGLGTAVATPGYVALFQMKQNRAMARRVNWIYLALPAVVSLLLFAQASAPLVFLIYPALLLVLLRLGLGWASLATLFVAGTGNWFTLRGENAFAAFRPITPLEPTILLQVFIAGAMFMLLSVAVVVDSRRGVERRLEKMAVACRAAEALAAVDPLTGLANRRRFDECLESEWRRALREGKPISLLLMDADLFKSYNDSYGHLHGDECLKQIAEVAQETVNRPGDLVARFGGEEFAVILPDTDECGAEEIAREICAALRRRRVLHATSPCGVMTLSVGCATLGRCFGQPARTLLEMADAALYRAKFTGRDRVCMAVTKAAINGGAREIA
jgi:diguanylate cyclase (GGDEF)-like protein